MNRLVSATERLLSWLGDDTLEASVARKFLAASLTVVGFIVLDALTGFRWWIGVAIVTIVAGVVAIKNHRSRVALIAARGAELSDAPTLVDIPPLITQPEGLPFHEGPTGSEELRVLGEILAQLRLSNQPPPTLPPDETVYWDKNPHIKHFLKRLWRIVSAWLVCALVVGVVVFVIANTAASRLFLLIIPAAVLLAAWYTARRYYKWKHLRLVVKGYDVYVCEPRNSYFMLYGQEQSLEIIECNKIVTGQTNPEGILRLRCGRLSIMQLKDSANEVGGQGSPMRDMFSELTDVREFDRLAILLRERRQEIMGRMSPGSRMIQRG